MTQRFWGLGVFLFVVVMIGIALTLEQVKHLIPCNLCILQRLAFISAGFAGLWMLVLPARTWIRRAGSTWLVISSLSGMGLSGRQIWLQHLPAGQAPACGPGFDYLISNFPLSDALTLLISGDGNCASVDWRLLGFSMAVWSCFGFFLLLLTAIKIFLLKK